MAANRPTKHTGEIVALAIAGGVVTAAASLLVYGIDLQGWHETTRVTARFSLVIFLTAFSIGPIMRLVPRPILARLLYERRGIGLGFAGAHTVHLGVFAIYYFKGGVYPAPAVLASECVGYALVLFMAATSNDWSVRALGLSPWRCMHLLGMYYIWAVFAAIYIVRIGLTFDRLLFDALFVALILALVLRLISLRPSTRKSD